MLLSRALQRAPLLSGCTCQSSRLFSAVPAQSRPLPNFSTTSISPLRPLNRSTTRRRISSTAPRSALGPAGAYDEQVESGIIQNDEHQRSIVALLQDMYTNLERYTPSTVPNPLAEHEKSSFFSTLFSKSKATVPFIPPNVPKGLYLYGSVGCGKSFLMDLFYANLPSRFDHSKRRVHFHAFMMDVHQRGHRMKVELGDRADWIVPIARELAQEARVLCFDEFQVGLSYSVSFEGVLTNPQVTDIADAMILRRLMESLMGYGVVAVMTSKLVLPSSAFLPLADSLRSRSRHPDELYKNGIQREQFMPCIDLIKDRFLVKCLDSDIGAFALLALLLRD